MHATRQKHLRACHVLGFFFSMFQPELHYHRGAFIICHREARQSNVHINQSTSIRRAKDEVTPPPTHRTGDLGAGAGARLHPPSCLPPSPSPSPCPVHTSRSCPPRLQAAAAVSATHRPDVAVRSRPQLAQSVLLRIHPPPTGGSDSFYIPHAPSRQINKNKQQTVPCTSTHSLLVKY